MSKTNISSSDWLDFEIGDLSMYFEQFKFKGFNWKDAISKIKEKGGSTFKVDAQTLHVLIALRGTNFNKSKFREKTSQEGLSTLTKLTSRYGLTVNSANATSNSIPLPWFVAVFPNGYAKTLKKYEAQLPKPVGWLPKFDKMPRSMFFTQAPAIMSTEVAAKWFEIFSEWQMEFDRIVRGNKHDQKQVIQILKAIASSDQFSEEDRKAICITLGWN